MAEVHSPVLLLSKFCPHSAERRKPGVTDSTAYDELVANYAALKAKVNTVLAGNVDIIRHGSVVDLTRNYIGAMGLQAMTSLLAKNDKLQELRLPGSGLSNDSVVFFCRAVVKHPCLTRLDFSCNNISLAAGLAILSLVQQNRKVVRVDLSETQVPEAVMKKIQINLDRNNALAAAAQTGEEEAVPHHHHQTSNATAGVDEPVRHSKGEAAFPSAIRETVRKAEWERREDEALRRLEKIMQTPPTTGGGEEGSSGTNSKFIPSPDLDSGWRLIEVAILAPPFLFHSEVELLVHKVFPRLNKELLNCKVHLLPLVDSLDGPAGTYLKNIRFAIAVDILRNVEKSRVLTIELIGDRAGEYQQLPANEIVKRPQLLHYLRRRKESLDTIKAGNLGAPPLQPVLQIAHKLATEMSSWVIIATRKNTRRTGVPPSLAPLLTEEPPVEHPDYLQAQIRRTVTVGADTVCKPQKIECDAAVKAKKWHEHQLFIENVLETAPAQELVIRNYNAVFDCCSEDGQIHFKNLEEFVEAMYKRVLLIMVTCFPPCHDNHPAMYQSYNINKFALKKLELYKNRQRELLMTCASYFLMKRNITNRLDLYIITPPSRNAFALHASEPVSVTALIGSFTANLMSKDPHKCRVAYHTTFSHFLTEEPTDLREIICSIILQLYPEDEIYRQAIAEVDIFRLQQLFVDVLTGKRKQNGETFLKNKSHGENTSDRTTTVVVLDGMDRVLPVVIPCDGLRLSEETGKEEWGTPLRTMKQMDKYSYIPMCLSRDVRLVLGCETNLELQQHLETRGRDSAELLSLGPVTPNDFDDMLRPDIMSRLGATLTDDDFVLIRKKEESLSPEYIMFVTDALRSLNEVPGIETHSIVASLPGTVKGMVAFVYKNTQKAFGVPFVRKFSRLLLCSRWGIYEPQLRAMMKIPQRRFNQLLRMMHPLLEFGALAPLGLRGGNALHHRVNIRSREFRTLLEQEDLQEEGSEEDLKVWHSTLSHCYLSVIHGVIKREETSPIFGLMSTSPYERMAAKELAYHVTQAKEWHILFHVVLSMPFLMVVYRNTLGYHLVRELIPAFNTVYEMYELGELTETSNNTTTAAGSSHDSHVRGGKPSLLRLRDYIYFLRHYNARFTEFPHLILQTAIESAARFTYVGNDAKSYLASKMNYHTPIAQQRAIFFEVMEGARKAIHHGAITACMFSPKGNRITTGSVDRSVCTVSPVTGAVGAQARQAPTRVEEVLYCETGAYHAAICHDRTILVYDSAQLKLVSRCDTEAFAAPLSSVAFSARGRFYLVTTEDLHLRVFETEKSLLLLHVDQRQFLSEGGDDRDFNLLRGYTCVLPHRVEDELFYATCHDVLTRWQLAPTRDGFVREARLDASFTVGSGKMLRAGAHALLHPAPFPQPADGRRPPPRFVHVYSFLSGREVAVLTSSGSQLSYQLSANEKLLACALDDGSVAVHCIPWMHLQQQDADMISVPPAMELAAFRHSPVATVRSLRFRGDSKGLFALGNSCEIKFWALPRRMLVDGDNNNNNNNEDDGSKREDEEELVEGVADGEFVLESMDITSWDVAQVAEPKETKVVVGDSTGKLTILRLWSPLM